MIEIAIVAACAVVGTIIALPILAIIRAAAVWNMKGRPLDY